MENQGEGREWFVGTHVGIPQHKTGRFIKHECPHRMGEVLRVKDGNGLVRCEQCNEEFVNPEDPGPEIRKDHTDRKGRP